MHRTETADFGRGRPNFTGPSFYDFKADRLWRFARPLDKVLFAGSGNRPASVP